MKPQVRVASFVLGAAVALAGPFGQARAPTPFTSTVSRIGDLIEANYFDEAKGRTIARELRKGLAGGDFERLRDPRDLAAALSATLQRHDGHFSVSWIPYGESEAAGPSLQRMDDALLGKRSNFGFRRVEILPGNIGLIELSEFADFDVTDASAEPRRVADAALELVERTDAVMVDLRDNGGGGAMAGYLLSHFLPLDTPFSVMRGRKGQREDRTLARVTGRHRPEVPVFVVVSGRTGSAAEFFAYSLQAVRRAIVVGQPTHGAANPGTTFDAGEGFGVFIPLDTPINLTTGTNWEGAGVQPDVSVEASAALGRAHRLALDNLLRTQQDPSVARDTAWSLEALSAPVSMTGLSLKDYVGDFGIRLLRVESGALVLRRGRWPPRKLRPLGKDVFAVEGSPWRRVLFDRNREGRVVALVEATSAGDVTRWRKTEK